MSMGDSYGGEQGDGFIHASVAMFLGSDVTGCRESRVQFDSSDLHV